MSSQFSSPHKVMSTLIFILAIIIYSLLSFTTIVAESSFKERPFNKIYAFGDSYTDTGNTQSSSGPANFMHVSNPPYGNTFFHHPTNRYSDGRLVIDFVTQSLSLPFLPPYRDPKADKSHGMNFAVAGSTAIRHSFFVKNNMSLNLTPQSLGTELIWFNRVLESSYGCKEYTTTPRECGLAFKDTLIWVGEIGANDYAYASFGTSVSKDTIQQLAISSVESFLKEILNKGANYVVVQGLPPTGCLTLTMALAPQNDRDELGCVATANKLSYNHNTKLEAKLYELRKLFPKALIIYADYWNAYATILKNPNKYGFKELFKTCCGSGDGSSYSFDPFQTCGSPSSKTCNNPAQYINWDGVHLTEAMYNAVSISFINGTFCNPTFQSLIRNKIRSG